MLRQKRCRSCNKLFQPDWRARLYCSEPCRIVGNELSRRRCYDTKCKQCGYISPQTHAARRKNPDYLCRNCATEVARQARATPCRYCGEAVMPLDGKPRMTCERCFGVATSYSLKYKVSRQYVQQLFARFMEKRGAKWRKEVEEDVMRKLEARNGSGR